MKIKLLNYLVFVSFLFAGVVWAGDVEDADAALLKNDYATALIKYKQAAKNNNSVAQFSLGNMYFNGLGVKQDQAEAVRWYKLAAAQGNELAQLNLGLLYDGGNGVLQDYSESVRWFKLAAAQGNSVAQNNLASMYHTGRGVIQSYVLSHMWFNLAALKSKEKSAAARDAISKLMTQQQVAEAQKLARECQARNFKNCD
jgi:hypothetical protein